MDEHVHSTTLQQLASRQVGIYVKAGLAQRSTLWFPFVPRPFSIHIYLLCCVGTICFCEYFAVLFFFPVSCLVLVHDAMSKNVADEVRPLAEHGTGLRRTLTVHSRARRPQDTNPGRGRLPVDPSSLSLCVADGNGSFGLSAAPAA
ncbi:hypothetical protein BS78_03G240600 [Paspalum vaginatum]|nr:hypothetical protein BS78_03G240600 [Paspalum vaginatum]